MRFAIKKTIRTPLGDMLALAVDDGLALLEFTDRRALPAQLATFGRLFACEINEGTSPILEQTQSEITMYFEGCRKDFTVPLALRGTPFQMRCWNALLAIPYGQTRSYLDQAIAIQNPKGVRAVGMANGANRLAIIVPCHRVVNSDGTLCGYGGGLGRKQRLLELESQPVLPF